MIISYFLCLFFTRPIELSLPPEGWRGFYTLGEWIPLPNHSLECRQKRPEIKSIKGVSSGSWNALFLCSKKPQKIIDLLFSPHPHQKEKYYSLKTIQDYIQTKVQSQFTTKDFDLKKLTIGISLWTKNGLKYYEVQPTSLEMAMEACRASSFLPVIMGSWAYPWQQSWAWDGGFTRPISEQKREYKNRQPKPCVIQRFFQYFTRKSLTEIREMMKTT
jgi:hypothetical protein